jgi:hypothetical protein
LPIKAKKYRNVAHSKLFIDLGKYIKSPGNHCREYQDSDMIGKCSIRVTATRVRTANEDPDGSVLPVVASDMVIGIIIMLAAK